MVLFDLAMSNLFPLARGAGVDSSRVVDVLVLILPETKVGREEQFKSYLPVIHIRMLLVVKKNCIA